MVYDDTYKFVVVVNKNLEVGKAMNDIAHSYARLVGVVPKELIDPLTKNSLYGFNGILKRTINL